MQATIEAYEKNSQRDKMIIKFRDEKIAELEAQLQAAKEAKNDSPRDRSYSITSTTSTNIAGMSHAIETTENEEVEELRR